MFASLIKALARRIVGLLFILATGILATVMAVLGPALWLLMMLAAGAAGLVTLACVVATIGVALGLSAPINLMAWLYGAGLFGVFVALHLLREKIARIPLRIAERCERRQQTAVMERLSGLRLVAPGRDV